MVCVISYRERLWPRWWAWLVPVFLIAVLAIAYGAAYGLTAGLLVFVPTTTVALLAIIRLSSRITVADGQFRVGRAHIPVILLGDAAVLSATDLDAALHEGDQRTFLAVRTWAAKTALVVVVNDPVDPHGYWLVSTRHPERLRDALQCDSVPRGSAITS